MPDPNTDSPEPTKPAAEAVPTLKTEVLAPETRKPWEQVNGESARHFAWFLVYLKLGRNRTIVEAEAKARNLQSGALQRSSGAFRGAARRNNWEERAIAWDLEQTEAEARTIAACRARQNEATAEVFALAAENVRDCFKAADLKSPEMRTVVQKVGFLLGKGNAIGALAVAHRAAFGDKIKSEHHETITVEFEGIPDNV